MLPLSLSILPLWRRVLREVFCLSSLAVSSGQEWQALSRNPYTLLHKPALFPMLHFQSDQRVLEEYDAYQHDRDRILQH